jgi:hypothetical protein
MKTAETSKTIVLGSEYDQKLREALLATLDELAGRAVNRSWGVGGSQELEQLDVAIGNETIVVEAETYIGLTIHGGSALVDRIAGLVRERMSSATA